MITEHTAQALLDALRELTEAIRHGGQRGGISPDEAAYVATMALGGPDAAIAANRRNRVKRSGGRHAKNKV